MATGRVKSHAVGLSCCPITIAQATSCTYTLPLVVHQLSTWPATPFPTTEADQGSQTPQTGDAPTKAAGKFWACCNALIWCLAEQVTPHTYAKHGQYPVHNAANNCSPLISNTGRGQLKLSPMNQLPTLTTHRRLCRQSLDCHYKHNFTQSPA